MRKSFKKAIAILISALMIMTSLPFAVFAADENVNIDLTGSSVGITAANDNRYSASGQTATLNIVNDQEDSNFSIGYVNIDISAYAGKQFKSFPLKFGKGADADGDCQGLKFWYTGNTNADSYRTNGRIANSSSVTGTNNQHLSKAVTYYALTEIASFTKDQFNAGTMSIDVADAANATLARGGSRLVIMVTQAQAGGSGSTGGWTDTKVTFNKAQTCSAVLTTGGPSTGKLTYAGTGLVVAGSESRWANSQFNIVNDQEANNTSAGILKFNVSGIKGKKVDSAKINYTVDSWGDDSTGLIFYYTTSTTPATYINGGETKSTGWSCGAGTTANNSFASNLGFSTSDTLANPQKSGTIANLPYYSDITAALQKAVDSGKDAFYVIIMQQTAGGKSGAPWSDTKVSPAKVTIDYTVSERARTRDDVASVKANLVAKNMNNYPYHATSTTGAADDSYTAANLGGNDKMSSVLYTYGVGGNSTYAQSSDGSYYLFGIQYGDVTLLYNGVDELAVPINGYFMRKGASSTFYPQSMYFTSDYDTSNVNSNNVLELKKIWHAGSGSNGGAGYKKDSTYGVNYYDTTDYANPKSMAMNENDRAFYYSNTLYIKANQLTFGDNKRATITKVRIGAKIHDESPGWLQSADKSRTYDLTAGSIRVINYKPVYDAIVKAKEIYNTVKDDELSYCPTDLYNFYTALDKLTAFNPNNYFNKTTNNYEACCTALAALDSYIGPAQTPLTKSTVAYEHSYTDGQAIGTQSHSGVCQDCGEILTNEACTWDEGTEITPATCTTTGTMKYTCTKCGGTATDVISAKGHDTDGQNWTYFNGDPKHYKQCKTCLQWVENEAHNYVEVEGTAVAPTCQKAGKEADTKCTGCKNVVTGATIEIDPNAHSFTIEQSTTTATCVTTGSVTYSCANGCSETYTEYGTIDADNHANIVTDNAVPATCTESGLTAGSHCEACEATIVAQNTVDPLDHSFTNYVSNNDAVTATCVTEGITASQTATCDREGCEATDTIEGTSTGLDASNHEGPENLRGVVAPTASKDGYTGDMYCDACNTMTQSGSVDPAFGDYEAYDDAVTEASVLVEAEYSPESWTALQTALSDAKTMAENADTQDEIDAAATMIQTAITNLAPATTDLTVTVNVEVDNDQTVQLTYTADYGQTVTIDVTDVLGGASIQKWTIEQGGATAKLSMANPVYDMVVTANATVTIIATANKTEEDPSYTKVKFTDRGYKTIGYGYVQNTTEIDVYSVNPIDGASIVAPEVAFYNFTGWEMVAKNVYVATYAVAAVDLYEVEAGSANIKVNGVDKDYIDYDENISITYTGDKMLGMQVDGKIIPITDINNVHAPYGASDVNVKIIEIEESSLVPTSMITGKYKKPGEAGKTITAFNAMYYLPEGCTLVECGVYAKKNATFDESTLNTATKVRSQSQSKNNEYTISMQSDYAASGVTKVYGMSYVTYKTAGGEIVTEYSDVAVINV